MRRLGLVALFVVSPGGLGELARIFVRFSFPFKPGLWLSRECVCRLSVRMRFSWAR